MLASHRPTAQRTARHLASTLALALVAVAALLFAAAAPAQAHAALVESTPADGADLDEAPTQLALMFNEDIEALGSEVLVSGPDGSEVGGGELVIDGAVVTESITATDPGTYTITWRVVSADGHPVSGDLTYTVAGGAAPDVTDANSDSGATDDGAEPTASTDGPAQDAAGSTATSEDATSNDGPSEGAATTGSTENAAQAEDGSMFPVLVGFLVALLVLAGVLALLIRRFRGR